MSSGAPFPRRRTGAGVQGPDALTALSGYASAPALALVLGLMFVAGLGFLLGVTTTNRDLLGGLDEDMRGRVMALWTMVCLGRDHRPAVSTRLWPT